MGPRKTAGALHLSADDVADFSSVHFTPLTAAMAGVVEKKCEARAVRAGMFRMTFTRFNAFGNFLVSKPGSSPI